MLLSGMIWFQEDTWEWQEYKLINESTNATLWLSIEEIEGSTKYSIYHNYIGSRINQDINIVVENEKYSLYEKGTAFVKNYYGNVDVDVRERVDFVEYISESNKSLFSIEYWDGEIEQTIGKYVDRPDIIITNEVNQSATKSRIGSSIDNKKANRIFVAMFSVILLAFMIIPIMSQIIVSNKSVGKYLKNSSSYTYVTSVTNNSNNKKADVYKSKKATIDETVKDIIKGVPEKINQVSQTTNTTITNSTNKTNTSTNSISNKSEASNNDGIGLITNSEYAYVYKGDDNNIYVQVSNKDYVNNSSTVYNSRSHVHYYRTYSTPSSSSSYDSYLSSARQSSVSSRISSGGGTSSGK